MLPAICSNAALAIAAAPHPTQHRLPWPSTATSGDLTFSFLQAAPQITLARDALEGEIASVTIGAFLFALSLATAGLAALRRKSRDPILIYFPVFCGLYGIRLLGTTPIVHFLIPAPAPFWS